MPPVGAGFDSVAEVRALRGEHDDVAMDEGYRQLAEQTTAEEAAEDRAITMSRRRRQAEEDAAAQ